MDELRETMITEKGKSFIYFCNRHQELVGEVSGSGKLFKEWWEAGADPRCIDEIILNAKGG